MTALLLKHFLANLRPHFQAEAGQSTYLPLISEVQTRRQT
jgi:hypothetical protein